MKMGIDIQEYLTKLGQERYRSIIIHTKPQSDASLRHYACQIHDEIGGGYLDVLGYFIANSQLAAEVDRFSPDQFKALLQDKSKGQKLFILDRLDFLLDTWRKSERQEFYRMIHKQWNSFIESMGATLIVCLQTSDEIESLKIKDSHGNSRIHRLEEFNELV
jgi:hypothetical protein